MSTATPSLRTIIRDHLDKFRAKAHTTFNGETITRVKHVNPTGPRGRWGVDVTMTDANGEEHRLAVSVVEVPDGGLPDAVQTLAGVISASMEFETDLNSERCRTAAALVKAYSDAMERHPEFDRAAFMSACRPSWMADNADRRKERAAEGGAQ